ncbi:MAG: GNAT family N-acetyltransferase [Firmicutes bacterium]|nr:GNAT family N-acetyltransferase [Bacillota bacterium]
MRRLPPHKRDTVQSLLSDTPENCSALFLLNSKRSEVLVDQEDSPKFFAIAYPPTNPPIYFLYGATDQLISGKRFLRQLKQPADLVVPQSLLPLVKRYWSVLFAVPILFLAAPAEWQPPQTADLRVRFLQRQDAGLLQRAFAAEDWLWEYFPSVEDLLTQGQVAAAFIDGELASVASTLTFTTRYCELGVATRPEFRGRGLALECARALSRSQFEQFGRRPCWRTQLGNIGSWKTAHRLGLVETPLPEEFVFLSNYKHLAATGVFP